MRDKLTELVNSKYSNVRVWEYFEYCGTCYLRFTTGNDLYIATIQKAGNHATILKSEGSILV